MIYNFHTHTARCHHATGSDEEYIECAIEAGIKYLGFSDHAPFIFPDGFENFYRVQMCDARTYVEDLRKLRKKYKDKIQISIGFEMEYYPAHFDKMLENVRKIGAEYLILGQHFILNEHPEGVGSIGPTDDGEHLRIYVDEVIEAMGTGVFSYVAHPDLVCFTGDESIYEREITRLCQAAKEANVPLEINLAGVRYDKHYPADRFWKIAGKVGAPVTVGYDVHKAEDLLQREQLRTAAELINRHKLNYIGMPRLRSIDK